MLKSLLKILPSSFATHSDVCLKSFSVSSNLAFNCLYSLYLSVICLPISGLALDSARLYSIFRTATSSLYSLLGISSYSLTNVVQRSQVLFLAMNIFLNFSMILIISNADVSLLVPLVVSMFSASASQNLMAS